MKAKPVLTHGYQVKPEATVAPVNRCGTYHDIAKMLLSFWTEWEAFSEHDQLSLAVPPDIAPGLSYQKQLALGTGSLKLKKSPYKDRDFTTLLQGTEFIQPLFDYVSNFGYFPCRPMIRYLPPKQCLSYHKDECGVRFHLVLSTHYSAFMIVQDVLYRMPEQGALYTLRTDVLHTAVNADLSKPRIHFTFSGYKDKA